MTQPSDTSPALDINILKSSRHAKITGDFAEGLVLYWLSKHGFECARVDHSGIDLIARTPASREHMGISVKSRCRATGTEQSSVSIPNPNFTKAQAACDAFGCVPYFAIVVDESDVIRAYLLSMKHLLEIHPMSRATSQWSMRAKALESYAEDPEIKCFEFRSKTTCWW